MDYIMGVSKKELEEYIVTRIWERFTSIAWGKNCDSLREALTFGHSWLIAGLQDTKMQKALGDYLLREKFSPKTNSGLIGTDGTEWVFPDSPKSEIFLAIKREFEQSYQEAYREYDKIVKSMILYFAESDGFCTSFRFENEIVKELMRINLADYNQGILVLRNRDRTESREFIAYEFLCDDEVVLLHKYQNSKIHEYDWHFDNLNDARNNLVNVHNYDVSVALARLLDCLNAYLPMFTFENRPKRFKYYMPIGLVRNVKKILEKYGIKITFFPMYDEFQYASTNYDDMMSVPVYIDAEKLKFVDMNEFGTTVSLKYKRFYNFYKKY